MRLYDTRRQSIEPFTPRDEPIKVYVCGVTPYDTTHMGHAFTMVTFDALVRYLEHRGHRVSYVQNVTDIDDSILGKAKEIGRPWDELGREQTEQYLRDLRDLHWRPPDRYVRASDEIPGIIEITQKLVRDGWAYESAGNVYYAVRNDPDYGQLSHLTYDEMLPIANQRGNHPTDPHKRDPLDFVLWQASQPGEPSWESPWGQGRPGWHIECSAMAMRYLGPQLDIHGGGADLIFPHHESEIAQSEHYTGVRPFVRFWLHAAMVEYAGAKMSKSLGNLVLVRNELRDHSADAIRLYLLSHHYRRPWEYREAGLDEVEPRARRLARAAGADARVGSGEALDAEPDRRAFQAALDDDFNTPAAIEVLLGLGEKILTAAEASRPTAGARATLRELGGVLGLTFAPTQPPR